MVRWDGAAPSLAKSQFARLSGYLTHLRVEPQPGDDPGTRRYKLRVLANVDYRGKWSRFGVPPSVRTHYGCVWVAEPTGKVVVLLSAALSHGGYLPHSWI